MGPDYRFSKRTEPEIAEDGIFMQTVVNIDPHRHLGCGRVLLKGKARLARMFDFPGPLW